MTKSSTVQPHNLFTVWSPDAVAECMDGVSDDLYRRLWALTANIPKLTADAETPDVMFKCALSVVWHLLTADEQVQLNTLAAAHIAN